MAPWLSFLHRASADSSGGVWLIVGLMLLGGLALTLPPEERPRARFPAGLLLAHVMVAMGRAALDEGAHATPTLRLISLFLLHASLGSAAFLLFYDWLLARRLRVDAPRIFRDLGQVLVYLTVGLVTLQALGVDPGSLLTTSALITAVIGLSLQETLGNLFAGLAIHAQRPFQVGDWVQFDGQPSSVGRVEEINWRATRLITNDRIEHIVPNGVLARSPLINFSKPTPVSRRIVKVQAGYEVPPRRVEVVLLKAVRGIRGVLEQPEPSVQLTDFGESGVCYDLLFYIDDFQARQIIDSEVRKHIWYSFQRAGIIIPYPVRDLRLHPADPVEPARVVADGDRVADLRRVDVLAALPEEALRSLAGRADVLAFVAGEEIVRQGEAGAELYILRRGEVSVHQLRGGELVELARMGPGAFFGEMSLLTGAARSATVRAESDSELLVLDPVALTPLLQAHPDMARRIGEVLVNRQVAQRNPEPELLIEEETARAEPLVERIRSFLRL